MNKIINVFIVFIVLICINQTGNSQKNCNGPFDVDLSSYATHTIEEVFQQLGITTLQEFNNLKPQFDMVISGTLLLDKSNQEIAFYGTRIKMLKNASIRVENNTTLTMNSVHVYSCGEMWSGIDVIGSTINVNASTIEDGVSAILVPNSSVVNLQSTIFNNNEVGLYLGSLGPDTEKITTSISDCTFTSDGNYLGETLIPRSGIILIHLPYTDLSPKYGERNTFQNLRTGIFAWSSAIRVNNSDFKNINSGSGFFNYAIHLFNYEGLSSGTSIINNNYFSAVNNAIKSDRSNIYAQYNEFLDVINGISVIDAGIVSINHNTISAKNIGIEINS